MIGNLEEIDPSAVAAIFYRPKDDVDRLLADFVEDLARQAVRVDGIVQRRFWATNGTHLCLQWTLRRGRRSRFISHSAAELRPVISIRLDLPKPQLSLPGRFATRSISL
ncbi:DUF2478 domain-containing protein [Bradyrhizobium sp. 26S5]